MVKITKPAYSRQIKRWGEINQFIAKPRMGGNWLRPAAKKIERIFKRLHEKGQLGNLMLDAGASWSSMAVDLSPVKSNYCVIAVDIGFPQKARQASKGSRFDPDQLRVKGDLHDLKAALDQTEVKAFLEQRAIGETRFKTVLMCDILNYLDFKQVLKDIKDNFLLPGGRIITCNMAGVLIEPGLAHPQGVKLNSELLSFVRKLGLTPEEIFYPVPGLDVTDNKDHISRQVLVLKRTRP